MGYQPRPIDPSAPMLALLADLKRIDKSGRTVSHREWIRLARRWATCKRYIERGEVPMSAPPRGGSSASYEPRR